MASNKILVISYNGFSKSNANGKTIQALLSAYDWSELIQFYRGNEEINFLFAESYFHVTDKQMLKSFLLKRPLGVYTAPPQVERCALSAFPQEGALGSGLRKHNYNFFLRWMREILWSVAPWGRRRFYQWLDEQAPKAVVYMVGESIFEDRLVRSIAKKKNLPVILYNGEGYRLVDPKQRRGIERLFYKIVAKSYEKLQKNSKLVVYNCNYLKCRYQQKYTFEENATVAFNASAFDTTPYIDKKDQLTIAYFGNLGVGRVASLLEVADAVHAGFPNLKIDVYGRPSLEDAEKLNAHSAVTLHGFVDQEKLRQVRENADILLHVESFDPIIIPKLKYAFSTKIAQCLNSGRCLLTYAPADMASTEYLLAEKCACVATSRQQMEQNLQNLIESAEMRASFANRALITAKKNHDLQKTAQRIKEMIGAIYEN